MLDLIHKTISWEKLYTHNKEECRISITKATVNKSGDTLKLAIKLNFIIPESDIDDIKKAISCKVEGLPGSILFLSMKISFCRLKKS